MSDTPLYHKYVVIPRQPDAAELLLGRFRFRGLGLERGDPVAEELDSIVVDARGGQRGHLAGAAVGDTVEKDTAVGRARGDDLGVGDAERVMIRLDVEHVRFVALGEKLQLDGRVATAGAHMAVGAI